MIDNGGASDTDPGADGHTVMVEDWTFFKVIKVRQT
jgi:hypothetical protein